MAIDLTAYWFDEDAADVACAFFETLLHHSKGEWAGRTFELQKWQRDQIIRPMFGWKRKSDGCRRFRKAYIELPRKNGKSTLSAGLALYMLFADGEPGAEVFSAASDRDQASIVFNEARSMVESSPALAKLAEVYKRSIVVTSTRSVYKVLSADAFTKHGLNASGIVFDELHAQPNRDLFDVLNTSTGARQQPMMVMITTAGYDRTSICYEQHEYARKVLNGVIDDAELFAYIAAADDRDDWTSPKTWAKANPGMGVTVKADYLEAEAKRAQNVPAYQNTFRRLHLNQWTSQETRWLDLGVWDKCDRMVDLALLKGANCYGGLDLASSSDIAAFVLDFPPEAGDEHGVHFWLPFFWIPEENMIERARKDRVPYDAWVRDGLMMATPGNVIDYDFILRDIERLGQIYDIKEIAFDRWGAVQLSTQLIGAGFEMVGFGQGFVSMSPPTKEFYRLVQQQELAHGGHPVLRWMADNVVVDQDAAGNLKPNKAKSREKIDGIVAGLMGLDRATRNQGKSVYESRGIREL